MALNFHVQAAKLSSGILNGPKLLGLLHHVNIWKVVSSCSRSSSRSSRSGSFGSGSTFISLG